MMDLDLNQDSPKVNSKKNWGIVRRIGAYVGLQWIFILLMLEILKNNCCAIFCIYLLLHLLRYIMN